MKKKTV